MKRAPSDYYEWTLERRRYVTIISTAISTTLLMTNPVLCYRDFLGAASIHQLCKTIVLENTHGNTSDCSNKLNSRFYAVIVQYTSRLQTAQLEKFVRSLIPGASRSNYHLRSAKPEDVARLTGAEFNGVCPIGNKTEIPIVLSERLLNVPTGWMYVGGGEPELKLGFSVQEFIQQTGCFVADIAEDGMTTDDSAPTTEAPSPAPTEQQS